MAWKNTRVSILSRLRKRPTHPAAGAHLDPRDIASRLKISFTRVFRIDLIGISARDTHLQEPAHILAQPVAGDGDTLHLQHRLPASCVLENPSVGAHVGPGRSS